MNLFNTKIFQAYQTIKIRNNLEQNLTLKTSSQSTKTAYGILQKIVYLWSVCLLFFGFIMTFEIVLKLFNTGIFAQLHFGIWFIYRVIRCFKVPQHKYFVNIESMQSGCPTVCMCRNCQNRVRSMLQPTTLRWQTHFSFNALIVLSNSLYSMKILKKVVII